MTHSLPSKIVAFAGERCLAAGDPAIVLTTVKAALDAGPDLQVLMFDGETSQPVEFDFRGTPADVSARAATIPGFGEPDAPPGSPRGPGRPKLGVVAREVTLLPRHWEWLSQHPGGASVAIRKLVDDARRDDTGKNRRRLAQESMHRFMSAMAGNYPRFEDALRALYANDRARFTAAIKGWPADVRKHIERLSAPTFSDDDAPVAAN